MKKKYKVLIVLFAILIFGFSYVKYRGAHTYTLTDLEHEQIKPIFGKVRVWSNVDTDVTFIDEQGRFRGSERAFFPLIGLFGIPDLCRENLCVIVLHNATHPCRNALALSPIPMDMQLI